MSSSCIFMKWSHFLSLLLSVHIQKIALLSNCTGHYYFHTVEVETEAERFTVTVLNDFYMVIRTFSPKLPIRRCCLRHTFFFFLVCHFFYFN